MPSGQSRTHVSRSPASQVRARASWPVPGSLPGLPCFAAEVQALRPSPSSATHPCTGSSRAGGGVPASGLHVVTTCLAGRGRPGTWPWHAREADGGHSRPRVTPSWRPCGPALFPEPRSPPRTAPSARGLRPRRPGHSPWPWSLSPPGARGAPGGIPSWASCLRGVARGPGRRGTVWCVDRSKPLPE